MAPQCKVGQLVEMATGCQARIRFVGETSFAPGEWIGVEFKLPEGKNDGSVNGQRYFTCPPQHGMFVRAASINHVLEQPKSTKPKAASATPSSGVPKGRPSGIAPPRSRSSILPPPQSRTSIAPPLPGKRASVAHAVIPQSSHRSVTGQDSTPLQVASPSAFLSTSPPITYAQARAEEQRLDAANAAKKKAASDNKAALAQLRERDQRATLDKKAGLTRRRTNSASSTESVSPPSAVPRSPPSNNEIKDLQLKLAAMQQQRKEDQIRFEKVQQDRDRFEAIIQKLQTKYQPYQQELQELRRQLQESEARYEHVAIMQGENDDALESATLDREMAEEKAEAIKEEADSLKLRLEELELENEILKDEKRELSEGMSPEERASKGWFQMEHENERLREALVRLRDMSRDQESQLKQELNDLRASVQELGTIKQQRDDTHARLLEAEVDMEELRQQLEAALGAEELIEKLTERNFALTTENEELRTAVTELESLKDLSDELEFHHVENENQLQELVDYKDSTIAEQTRLAAQQEETIADQQYTISRFRELVSRMQSDLEDIRASKEITEIEAQELSSQSRAMMDLNRQLQLSVSNGNANRIDMELRKCEAQESAERLAILGCYLPASLQTDQDSVHALMRSKRVAFKARLLQDFIKQNINSQNLHSEAQTRFAACEALYVLTWVASMGDRFTNSITGCSVDRFHDYGRTYYELEPVERTLNAYIHDLKSEELREAGMTHELQRSMALMSHLSERYLDDRTDAFADKLIMTISLVCSSFQTVDIALQGLTDLVATTTSRSDETDEAPAFLRSADVLTQSVRGAKFVAQKTVKSLEDLRSRSLSLKPDTWPAFERCEIAAKELSEYTRKLGEDAFSLIHDEGGDSQPTFSDVSATLRRTTESTFDTTEPAPLHVFASKLRVVSESLAALHTTSTDLTQAIEFERAPPPWVLHSQQLSLKKAVTVDAETELARLTDEARERATQLRLRDQALEEANVRIELLEARSKDATKKSERIRELEGRLVDITGQGKRLEGLVARLEGEMKRVEGEKEALRSLVNEGAVTGGNVGSHEMTAEALRRIEMLEGEISVLDATNKFLRRSARRTMVEQDRALGSWLEVPLAPGIDASPLRGSGKGFFEKVAGLPGMLQRVDVSLSGRCILGVKNGDAFF